MGLASALDKPEHYQQGFLELIFLPGRRLLASPLPRTHPTTEERIRRLRALHTDLTPTRRTLLRIPIGRFPFMAQMPQVGRVPRWRLGRLWF
jgi:heat shock protein HtpX